jgi:hypothetical protein
MSTYSPVCVTAEALRGDDEIVSVHARAAMGVCVSIVPVDEQGRAGLVMQLIEALLTLDDCDAVVAVSLLAPPWPGGTAPESDAPPQGKRLGSYIGR